MSSNDLIYSHFQNAKKTPFILRPFSNSMMALTPLPNDNGVNPPAFVPETSTVIQHSTLPRITKEDVNTVKPTKLPFLTNMYIGSLSVVGLFILFRFIQKHP